MDSLPDRIYYVSVNDKGEKVSREYSNDKGTKYRVILNYETGSFRIINSNDRVVRRNKFVNMNKNVLRRNARRALETCGVKLDREMNKNYKGREAEFKELHKLSLSGNREKIRREE